MTYQGGRIGRSSHIRREKILGRIGRSTSIRPVMDQNIDTSDTTGRLLFNMFSVIAQFETEIRAERQMDGIQKARERGVCFGHHKALAQE